jgi:cellulose biosynthesis protein BcsQ
MKTLVTASRKGRAGKSTIGVNRSPLGVPAQASRLRSLPEQARAKDADHVILDTAPHANGIAPEAASHADVIFIRCEQPGA